MADVGENPWSKLIGGIPTPLKNMSSSVGIMIFPISIYIYIISIYIYNIYIYNIYIYIISICIYIYCGKIKFMFQTTNQFISSTFMYHIFTVSETHSLRTRTDFREKSHIIAARNPQLTSNISSTKPPKAV